MNLVWSYLGIGAEAKILQDFKARHVDEPLWHALIQASGKLVLIDKLLPKLKQSGHKACLHLPLPLAFPSTPWCQCVSTLVLLCVCE